MDCIKYPITSIPSGGIAYPTNWEIEIEPFKFGQSSGIASTKLTQLRFYKLIMSGIHCNFNKEILLLQDILFLGLARKLVSTTSSDISVRSRCPECYAINKSKFNLVDAIKFAPAKIKDRDKYPVEVRFSNYTAWFRHLTYKEFLELAQDENATEAARLAKQLVKLVKVEDDSVIHSEESPLDIKKLIEILNSFTGNDADILLKVIEVFNSTEILPLKITCQNPECCTEYEYNLNEEDLSSVLSPFRNDQTGSIEDAIIL